MQQSPSWEATRFPGNQKIPRTFLNPKLHYRTQKWPSSIRILNQLDPAHIPTNYFLNIHLNIILSSTSGSSKWSLSLSGLALSKPLYTYLQSLAVERAIYNCPWHQHMQTARHIRFIIMRAQKPVRFTAGKFYILSLETYLQV